jgi:hypothetical protein
MSRVISPVSAKPYGLANVCRVWRGARSSVYRHQAPLPDTPPGRRGPVGPMPDDDLTAIRAVLLEPIHQGVRRNFGGFAKGVAGGLAVRHDDGSQTSSEQLVFRGAVESLLARVLGRSSATMSCGGIPPRAASKRRQFPCHPTVRASSSPLAPSGSRGRETTSSIVSIRPPIRSLRQSTSIPIRVPWPRERDLCGLTMKATAPYNELTVRAATLLRLSKPVPLVRAP